MNAFRGAFMTPTASSQEANLQKSRKVAHVGIDMHVGMDVGVDVPDGPEEEITTAEQLEKISQPLREKINPLYTGEKINPFCQYRAFCRAAFGDEKHCKRLQSLAVQFLRVHKSKYLPRVASTELIDRASALQKLVDEKKIPDVDYDGWCTALELGLEWGQDFTLQAMAYLMRVEARVVHNLPLQRASAEPRIMTLAVNPTAHAGEPVASIYLVLSHLHYTTLEEKPQSLPRLVPAGVAPSVVSYDEGSLKVAEDDPTKRIIEGESEEEGIMFEGIPYSGAELLSGVTLEDGNRLWLDDSGATEYVLYLQHRHTDFQEERRRYPKKLVRGPPKPKKRHGGEQRSLVAVIPEEDVAMWQAKLKEKGHSAGEELAQALLDSVNSYIDTLNLVPAKADSSMHIDQLGNKMYAILERTRRIKLKYVFEASSVDQPHNKVLVVGVEGAGKSTKVNAIVRHVAKPDAELAAANPVLTTSQEFEKRYALEPELDETPIHVADAALEAYVFDPKAHTAIRKMKPSKGDILPTGQGGSMTALVTTLRLNPSITRATLKLTYRPEAEVKEALDLAEQLRTKLRDMKADEDAGVDGAGEAAIDLGGRDPKEIAYMVCEMVGSPSELLTSKAKDGVENLIRDFDGAFELRPHEYALLGRVRKLTVGAPTHNEMAEQIRRWLMLYTIGKYSHWPIIRKVEIELPSTISFTLSDVPGFSDADLDPFRQRIVADELNHCECSTMLYCLALGDGGGRLKGPNKLAKASFDDASGVCEQLFGDPLKRKVGFVLTSASLDWSMKNFLDENQELEADELLEEVVSCEKEIVEDSSAWLSNGLRDCARNKSVKDKRIGEVLTAYTKSFAVDVKGTLEARTKSSDHSIAHLVNCLLENAKDSLNRHQTVLFNELINEGALPFYSELSKMGALRAVQQNGSGAPITIQPPNVKAILNTMKERGNSALIQGNLIPRKEGEDGPRRSHRLVGQLDVAGGDFKASVATARESNSRRATIIYQQVMKPRFDAANENAVRNRWEKDLDFAPDYFSEYRRPRCQTLGNHLKALAPSSDGSPGVGAPARKLINLTMPEVANDMALPVQEHLREIRDEIIFGPLEAMTDVIVDEFTRAIQRSRPGATKEKLDKLAALETLIFPSLENCLREQRCRFAAEFANLLATLPLELSRIIRQQMAMHLGNVANAHGNKRRLQMIGSGAHNLAQSVATRLKEYVLNNILDVLHHNFHESLEEICRFTHSTFVEAVTGSEARDYERLQPISLYHSRLCAGILTAVHQSGLLKISDFEGFDAIKELAAKPAGLLDTGKGFADFLSPPRAADSPLDDDRASPTADDESGGWRCPGCRAPERQVNMGAIGVLGLSRPTCAKFPGTCWCEDKDINPKLEHCKLCIMYFKKNHRPRNEAIERRRVQKTEKRKSIEPDVEGGGKRMLLEFKKPTNDVLAPAAVAMADGGDNFLAELD